MDDLVEVLARGRGGCVVIEVAAATEVELSLPPTLRTVRVRPSPHEQSLAYAGLAQLCDPLLTHLDRLPPVQAAALAGALALAPPTGDALAVAAGFRSLLLVAADVEPLAVVVDGAHLLDRASAGAIAHAARRLDAAPVALILVQDPAAPGRLELPDVRHGVASPARQRSASLPDHLRTGVPGVGQRASAADVAARLEAASATGSTSERVASLLTASATWLDAGRVEHALRIAQMARAQAPDGDRLVAQAELLLGRIESVLGNGRTAAAHLRAAAQVAASRQPALAAAALLSLASSALFAGRVEEAEAALDEAQVHLREARLSGEDVLWRRHRAASAAFDLATGRSADVEVILTHAREIVDGAALTDDLPLLITTVALPLVWLERYDAARALLAEVIDALRLAGALGALPMPLCALSVAERRAGRPTRALLHASEARDLAEQTGHRVAWLFAQAELANVHSLFGDVDRCRAAAEAVLGEGGAGRGTFRTSALSALATAELWSGDPAAVIPLLEPLVEGGDALGQSVTMFDHTLLAAYVAVGRRSDAQRLLEQLEAAALTIDGRMAATAARCSALLAPVEERDERFAEAIGLAGDQPVTSGLTRLLYARRLLADGEVARGAALLRELAELRDENALGVARAARLSLTRLGMVVGGGDPLWASLAPAELEVALAATEHTSVLTLADRLRLSPPEVEQLRDDVVAVVGARAGPELAEAMRRPAGDAVPEARVEVRVLGGLQVLVEGVPVEVPAGAASTALALLALRRSVHLEELTEVLWPDAEPGVARRRLRNVLTRIRRAAGEVVRRHGDRIELAPEVVVDHHLAERRARRALALPPGAERAEALAAILDAHRGALLPELLYEDWTAGPRHRAEAREDELRRALQDEARGAAPR